jgi:hypothetical protein
MVAGGRQSTNGKGSEFFGLFGHGGEFSLSTIISTIKKTIELISIGLI